MAEVCLKNGVVPEMINIPRFATRRTVNIHSEPPLFVLERVDGFPNLQFRECPACAWQCGHNGGLEIFMPAYGVCLVVETICQECQRQLRRAAADIAPLKPGRTVIPQVQSGIEWLAANGDHYALLRSSSFVSLHAAPPNNWDTSSADRCSGWVPGFSN